VIDMRNASEWGAPHCGKGGRLLQQDVSQVEGLSMTEILQVTVEGLARTGPTGVGHVLTV
jgi:hypothetical protein